MSWRHPPHEFTNQWTLDPDQVNESFAEWQSELSGRLNEHNWQAGCLDVVGNNHYTPDISLRLHHSATARRPEYNQGVDLGEVTTEWERTFGNTVVTFNSRGGVIFMVASLQLSNYPPAGNAQPGVQFCFGINGVPHADCMIGSGDMSNDLIDGGKTVFGFTSSGGTGATGGYANTGTGPGIRQIGTPVTLYGSALIPPGRHTVELLYRSVNPFEDTVQYSINSRELFVIEGHALGRG